MARVGASISRPGSGGILKMVVNPEFPAEMSNEPTFLSMMRAQGQEICRVADHNLHQFARAPFMPRPGHEDNPFIVEEDEESVMVVNTDYGAIIYEFGAIRTPAYAPLRRAVEAVGLTFTEVDTGFGTSG